MEGHFTRSHVGGMIPLFYEWLVAMVVSTAGGHLRYDDGR
jgi:hypothetical protein